MVKWARFLKEAVRYNGSSRWEVRIISGDPRTYIYGADSSLFPVCLPRLLSSIRVDVGWLAYQPILSNTVVEIPLEKLLPSSDSFFSPYPFFFFFFPLSISLFLFCFFLLCITQKRHASGPRNWTMSRRKWSKERFTKEYVK